MDTNESQTVLVLGATGKTGRRVVSKLAALGHQVRAASRHPGDAAANVTPTVFDWADGEGHASALEGADAVYVVPPAFVVDHADQHVDLFVAAKEAGVRRAVMLSARGVNVDDSIPMRRAELALFDSDLDATVIRPTWFAQNFTEGFFSHGVDEGVIATAAGDGLEPFIDADDIADVAVTLLVSSGHDGMAYDLSGSESLSFHDAAARLSDALGREIRHVNISIEDYISRAIGAGVPADYAAMLAGLNDVIRQGWDAHISDGVATVLGRPANSFTDWTRTLSAVN
jgi:uncharacterized protein YbjT (DUF2867 family)